MTADPGGQTKIFDEAVKELQNILDKGGFPGDGYNVGPKFRPDDPNDGASVPAPLYTETLNAIATALSSETTHHWSKADRVGGMQALGALLSSIREATEEFTEYFMYDIDKLHVLVSVLQDLKRK